MVLININHRYGPDVAPLIALRLKYSLFDFLDAFHLGYNEKENRIFKRRKRK